MSDHPENVDPNDPDATTPSRYGMDVMRTGSTYHVCLTPPWRDHKPALRMGDAYPERYRDEASDE